MLMNIASIICELDPLHNGHKYLLDTIRDSGADCIIACMSGNFTQRGAPAAFDKHTRAIAALNCGAELVIELPLTFACAGAERFAFGGVSLLDSLGCVDSIFFGSECGDIGALRAVSDCLASPDLGAAIREKLKDGITFAKAREQAVGELIGEERAMLLRSPNNILAIEYLKALSKLKSGIRPYTIKRRGAGHDSGESSDGFASASYIRELAREGGSIEGLVPKEALDILSECIPDRISRPELLERAVLYRLKCMSREELAELPDISEGLENRLYAAIRRERSVAGILDQTKTKRYTMARLRRLVTCALLGISRKDMEERPLYIRVLGFNESGRSALSEIKKRSELPIVTRLSDGRKLEGKAREAFELSQKSDEIYDLCIR